MSQDRFSQGMTVLTNLTGFQAFPPLEAIRDFYPDFYEMIITNGFADIYARPGLDDKQRELITLSSLITQGAVEQLDFHIHAALNVGVQPQEIAELAIHCSAYAGFPKAISAIHVIMRIYSERGIQL